MMHDDTSRGQYMYEELSEKLRDPNKVFGTYNANLTFKAKVKSTSDK